MGLFDGLFKNRDRLRESIGQARETLTGTRDNFSDFLNQMIQRGESASNAPALTAQDLFGESMQRLGDQTGAHANAAKAMFARSLMGSGGDLSGSAGANILGIDQQLNEALGKNALNFENLTMGENRFRQNRGDRLISGGLQGLMSLYGMDQNNLQDFLMQDQARRQGNRDFWGNLLQAGSTVAASAIAAPAAVCWVAIELYGEDSNEYHSIRNMLLEHEKSGGTFAKFVEQYREDGAELARQIQSDPERRAKTKVLFDHLYELSKAA